MFDFRKSSETITEQFIKLFRDEKKYRKNGNVEDANFDFMKLYNENEEHNDVEKQKKKQKRLSISVCM